MRRVKSLELTASLIDHHVEVDKRVTVRPELNLLEAVLISAINDLYFIAADDQYGEIQQRQRLAKRWIESNDFTIFSFRWVCQHLELDHNILRTNLSERKSI